uniref:Conjugal transfer protein TrbE n=1 Tax=OCS116 cluster bacterium TaxID=2030921 RepID=A0A2A4Z7R8_9PROT
MFNLREYQKRPNRLADYLPWAALIAPGIVLNKDGSFQRTARYRGPDLDSSTQSELVATSARINDALKRFGSGWAIFFEADRHEISEYPKSDFPDLASWLVEQERKGAFEADLTHYDSTFYLTLCYLPPEDRTNKAQDLLLETPDNDKGFDARDHLNAFINQSDRAFDLFAGTLPELEMLDDDETLTYLHGTISTKRHPIVSPEIPLYLDAILADCALTGGLAPMLGDAHMRIITITSFPGSTTAGILDALNNLGISYRWSSRFISMDKVEAIKVLGKYRRQWFAKRKSVMSILKEVMTNEQSVLVDTDADNKVFDADAAMQELGGDLVSYGYFTTTITVWDKDIALVDEKLRIVERTVNSAGFTTINETVNAIDAWLGSLPGHTYANVRQPIISSLNLAHMTPLSSVWAGQEYNEHFNALSLLMAETGGATPFRLNLHQGDVGHSIVAGPTGAGKSVLVSLIAMQFRRYDDSQVYIFDKGGSARTATLAMGGTWFDLGGADDIGEAAFQPLANIDEANKRVWAHEWICDLIAHEEIVLTPEYKEGIWSALVSLSQAPKSERTLTGLSALFQSNVLRQALQPYTLSGPHGRLLDADLDKLNLGSVQCFEMEELMHTKSTVLPVLTYLFHRLEEKFDGKPTLLILDEAWVFLDDPEFAGRIREWLKTLRKRNVSVVFATQSLSDIANSSIAPALIESCPSRIFLPNERALEPQQHKIYESFGLNVRQIAIISRAASKREYYFQSSKGNRLFDLALGPIALAFTASSSKQDHQLLDRVIAEGGGDFVSSFLTHKNLEWANSLIDIYPQNQ